MRTPFQAKVFLEESAGRVIGHTSEDDVVAVEGEEAHNVTGEHDEIPKKRDEVRS